MKTFVFGELEISEDNIKKEVKEIEENKLFDSDSLVFKTWFNFAQDWFSDPDEIDETLAWGFRGFHERKVEDILQDFEANADKIKEIL